MDASFFQTLQEKHLAIWKESDAEKRLGLMQEIYAEQIRMFDPEFTLNGYQEISDFIQKLHAGAEYFDFKAAKPIEAIAQGARLFWTIRMKANDQPLTGMDFFIVENERVVQLFAFIDKAS